MSEGGNSFKFHIIGGGKEDLTVEGGGSGSVSGGFYPAGTPHYKGKVRGRGKQLSKVNVGGWWVVVLV